MRSLILIAALMAGVPVAANTPPEIGGMAQTGEASFSWLGIPLYDAKLFTQGGAFDWSRPFALSLSYRQTIPGTLLVSATMSELKRIEGDRPDHPGIETAVATCFRSVSAGDRIVAVAQSQTDIAFWLNGSKTCEISLPDIRDRFFGIWLSENSRDQALTRQLLGRE